MTNALWLRRAIGSLVVLAFVAGTVWSFAEEPTEAEARATANKEYKNGNFADAYDGFRKLLLDPKSDPMAVSADLGSAFQALARLGRMNEQDELLESSIAAHAKNWRLLQTAAQLYVQANHSGFMIAGEYERGPHRGGGRMVNSLERDRVRALQLMQQARPLVDVDDNKGAVAAFYYNLAQQLLYNRGFHEAWRLQYLTNLAELPDYDEGYPYYRNFTGAPVDEEGKPVFHTLPKSWEEAKTDGQRWRFALMQVVENDPKRLNEVRIHQAQFYQNQFGVQTMAQFGHFLPRGRVDDTKEDESGTYALHTLKEDETIARLATGIKRFNLPDEFNFIKIYQQVAADAKNSYQENALNTLAQIFQNRRQYPKSAEYWQQSIDVAGPGNNDYKVKNLHQITDNWGRFESIMTQPAGQGATVEFRFRNGNKVKIAAHRIKVAELLDDVKAYLKSDPGRLDWQQANIGNLGHRLVTQNQKKYVGEEVAAWDLKLDPRPHHFDRRITVTTPLQEPGAYLVTATMVDGNVSNIVMWVADTAIVRKQLSGKNYFYVADAVAGKPVGGANLEFFGYQQKRLGGNRYQILTTQFAEKSDADGQVIPDPRDLMPEYQWLITARGDGNRFAYLGFQGVWTGNYYDAEYNQIKIFNITDRPVYRPAQTMQYKFWARHAQYDQDDNSQFANQSCTLELYNPQGEKLVTETLKTDEYGGVEGKWEIPSDAMLGQYNLQIRIGDNKRWVAQGGGNFRVEEYKKPEYEVTIAAPTEPVMLGEKFTAKIEARYYFGSPVTEGTVKYKVTRTQYDQNWYPIAPWDWFYGTGYWWFCYDTPWYPGWQEWAGCMRPSPWWWHGGRHNPPELVAEQEVEIGPDGTVNVEIDTAIAKELHGDQDHQYTITAEVRDQSRRTIVGTGEVLVARKPFKVFTWVDQGYYRVGDTVTSHFKAQTLDNQPVEGTGVLTLYKVTYDDKSQPVETPVRRWDLDTNVEGVAAQQIRASAKGQYRLNYELTDAAGHKIEGGYLFTIIGEGFDGSDYRFNSIELIPNKQDYAPGDMVKLQINTDRPGSTVLLFLRPANGVYLPPKVVHMEGKSTVEDFGIVKKDMPNIFVEAVTVYGGKVFQESKEIVVPPESRVVDVKIVPSGKEFLPGQEAKVKLQLTDFTGEPIVGSTVVSIYDKSLEYISGGSNVPDIREFFWKWRRHHNPNQATSLAMHSGNVTLPGEIGMANVGIFGATVADDLDAAADREELALGGVEFERRRAQGGGFGGGGAMPGLAMAQNAAGAPMAAMADKSDVALADGAMPTDGVRKAAPGNKLQQEAQQAPEPGAPLVEATVRSNFADTALWSGSLETDKTGMAEVSLKMPENLTTWKVRVWAMGHGTKVGSADTDLITRKNLIVRLQAPRFFVQKDEVVLSANVHNYLKSDKEVTVSLEIPGDLLSSDAELTRKVMVPANGETRVDWRVKVLNEGEAVVRMKALTDEESDAMEMKLPSYIHGMLKTEAWAGTVRPDQQQAGLTFNVPADRRVEQSVLEVRYSPTLAGAMVDALPYLVDYPYGCTEQTLNRFLPTVITQKTLLDMKLDLGEIERKRTNLNAQEIGQDVERAKQWKRYDRNPVFNEEEVDRMVKDGVKRLTSMQNGDGGWGWFSGHQEHSWPHTTAVVVHGLQVAQHNDVTLVPGMLERGVAWLKSYQEEEVRKLQNAPAQVRPWKQHADNLDALVYMVLVDADVKNDAMRDFLYRDRVELAVYSKAMFGLALEKQGNTEQLAMILRNLQQFLVEDAENESAYLKLPQNNYWWYWYGSETEANAYYLKLLSKVEPTGQAAPRLVKYLLNNRKHATYWASTRDTAVCVEAFAAYLQASGELNPDMTVQVWLDGEQKQEVAINRENLFTFDNKFVLTGADVTDGSHKLELRRTGKGPVYFNTYLTNFTLEDPITKAGLEVKVSRKYYKLEPVKKEIKVEGSRGQALDQRVEKYNRVELENLAMLTSGDLVEIELEIDSKNDYEYILFEDMKAAGFEPVDVRSGYTNNGLHAYMELRDNRVALFVRALARGKHSISYRMRAEIPGKFSALPTRASAMYAPELKANSDELKLQIQDAPAKQH